MHAWPGTAILLFSSATMADENCGRMVVQSIQIDGTVEAIEPLAGASSIDVGDIDPLFIVRLRPIESAGKVWTPQPLRSRRLEIGVHSPVELGIKYGAGRYQFQAMSCDGAFRRLIGFAAVPSTPATFDGSMEVGNMYRAEVRFDGGSLETVIPPHPPMHHVAGIDWLNLEEFASVRSGKAAAITFVVESRETGHRGESGWWTRWNARILRIEPE